MGQALPDLGDVSQSEMSPLQERRFGEGIMRENSQRQLLGRCEITDYLNAIGKKLAAAVRMRAGIQFLFLINDPQVNAFALPGGFIGVNAGLL